LFVYQAPRFVGRQFLDLSIFAGNGGGNAGSNPQALAALAPAAGGASPEQLGALAPAAGGGLGDLAPSAGGLPGDTSFCANALLDQGWNQTAAEQANCSNTPGSLKPQQ
jgi:hypothetical protein